MATTRILVKAALICSTAFLLLALKAPVRASSHNYSFGSGADEKSTFGSSSSIDSPVQPDAQTQNVRRNKDASNYPPGYGVFSGELPTGATNPNYTKDTPIVPNNVTPAVSQRYSDSAGGMLPSTSVIDNSAPSSDTASNSSSTSSDFTPPTTYAPPPFTSTDDKTYPRYYDDGSIGLLTIPKIGLKVKVWEGENPDSLQKGVGHFENTSAWDGNVAIAGHNRGAAEYFGKVKNLNVGDEITYETLYGSRTYTIALKKIISATDMSYLGYEPVNTITLITCVEDKPEQRWVVQAVEKVKQG